MKILKSENKDISGITADKKYKTDRLAEALSFPQGTFKNFPTIQIRGNREITIDGCTGLLSYEEENILLETKYCRININGRTLTLSNLTKSVLAIRGFIKNVEFTM
ncbi:MAG: YabP/YqfC family sporulation protein [Oscillospiraceae bacterium]|nr:YabP/YqfC family sporulation protein [Oscillospiraceae bacterium]